VRVFISSTCYDLIDVRAELAEQLIQIGITPVLSDDKLSDFQVKPDVNSIETCLVNVESCEEFILILDRRYGASLKDCGFDDFSATHLEYKQALAKKIPVRVYVRDRLEADYSIWKRNGRDRSIKYMWVSDKNTRLFELLNEHSKLQSDSSNSNWYSTFTSSIDLKAAISKHFEKRILPKRVVEAIQNNTFPLIDVNVEIENTQNNTFIIRTNITNVSNAPAFKFDVHWEGKDRQPGTAKVFLSKQSTCMTVFWEPGYEVDKIEKFLIIEYQSALGISIRDKFCINVKFFSPQSILRSGTLIERKYSRSPEIVIEIED
jgi:Domain of unknown function (DUF4062)